MFGILAALIILVTPTNGSTVSSSTLSWQSVDGSVEYSVLVDDEPTVSSPYIKSSYPTNTSYTPQSLSPGTYYWKVKSKDTGGSWSDWSEIWSFSLISQPSPTPSTSTSPSPSPTPSSSTQPSSSPKTTKSSSSGTSTASVKTTPASSVSPSATPAVITEIVEVVNQNPKPSAQLPKISSIAGEATQSSEAPITEVAADTQINWKRILGVVVLLLTLMGGFYIWKGSSLIQSLKQPK